MYQVSKKKSSIENPFVSIYKACNNGSNEEKYKLIKSKQIEVPRYIDVELTNSCNFKCRFCPTGTKSMNRTKGFMSDEVVNAISENVFKYKIPGVRFIRWGEPTIHPKYIQIVSKIKSLGALIHINTNGSALTEESIQKLLTIPLDSIKISFQGVDEKSYNEMRFGGDYEKLLNVVKTFARIRESISPPPSVYFQISTTITDESEEQVEQFKQAIEPYCDFYNIGFTHLNHLNVDNMNVSDDEKEKIRQMQKHERIHKVINEVCGEAFDKLSINWNGDVTLCCSDYDNFMLVGNILDMDLKQIFNSQAADQYRKMILNRQHARIKCCSECYTTVPLNK